MASPLFLQQSLLAKSVRFLGEMISLKMTFLRENVQNINLFSPNLPPPKLSMYVFLCLMLSLWLLLLFPTIHTATAMDQNVLFQFFFSVYSNKIFLSIYINVNYGTINKRRHQFFKDFWPLPHPGHHFYKICKLIKSKIIIWLTPRSPSFPSTLDWWRLF